MAINCDCVCRRILADAQSRDDLSVSGTDSKAGGRDYLLLFMQGKSITERPTPRRASRGMGSEPAPIHRIRDRPSDIGWGENPFSASTPRLSRSSRHAANRPQTPLERNTQRAPTTGSGNG